MILKATYSNDRGDKVIYSVEDSTITINADIDTMVDIFNSLLNTIGFVNQVVQDVRQVKE